MGALAGPPVNECFSAAGRTGELTEKPINRVDAWRIIQRRAADLGFRHLEAAGTLENAQAMAAHESPRTTKLYDRTGDEITLDEVHAVCRVGLARSGAGRQDDLALSRAAGAGRRGGKAIRPVRRAAAGEGMAGDG